MAVRAGWFNTPASTGHLDVGSFSFRPTWAFIVATGCTADDTWQAGISCLSRGIMGINPAGDLDWFCNKVVLDSTDAVSSVGVDQVLEVSSTLVPLGSGAIIRAVPVGFRDGGITLDFTVTVSGRKVFYVMGDDPAQYAEIRGGGVLGLSWDEEPTSVICIGMSDTSVFPTPGSPNTWGPGQLWTSCMGIGKVMPVAANNKFVSWGPCLNTGQKENDLMFMSHWTYASDVYAFGQVNPSLYDGVVSGGTDLTITAPGTAANMAILALDTQEADAGTVTVHADPSGAVDHTLPIDAKLVVMLGGKSDWGDHDDAVIGVSIGVVTSKGDQWLVAIGQNVGSGRAQYQSISKSWMSGWGPYQSPSTQTSGTATLSGTTLRTVTGDNAHATRRLNYAAFGTKPDPPEITSLNLAFDAPSVT